MKLAVKDRKSELRKGYSLLELMVTLTVLSILVLGTIPLTQNALKRQKEIRLRQSLRDIRSAIDEFKRDTLGACPQGGISNDVAGRSGRPTVASPDPRSRVMIDDCKIFDTENLDRFPPTLDLLVEGVKVKARGLPPQATGGGVFGDTNATELGDATKEVLKRYLREIPDNPMTPKKEGLDGWKLRSSYQDADSDNWDDVNVFDVRSASDAEALNGEKYSDW